MSNLYFYVSDSVNPYENIARECALMEKPVDGAVFYLWSNNRTVVIGKHQNAAKECDYKKLISDGGFLARRYSGGGAVFHDVHNLNFTFIEPKELYSQSKHFSVIISALKSFGLNAVVSGRNDMEIDGRKFSGNAFYSQGGYKLHHGTILIDTDTELMQKYLTVSRDKLVAHGVDSVRARVINLKELVPNINKKELISRLISAAQNVYNSNAVRLTDEDFDSIYIRNKKEYLESADWLFGFETYDDTAEKRFSWGKAEVTYKIEKGIVTRLNIFTDALDVEAVEKATKQILGKKLSELAPNGAIIHDDVIGLLV